jgi:ribose transport system permease protein
MEKETKNELNQNSVGAKIFKSNSVMMIFVLIGVIAIFSVMNSNYFSYQNMVNILYAASIVGLLAIGQTYLIIAGHIDLSSGAVAAMFGVVVALFLQAGMAWPLAAVIAIAMSLLIGLVNAGLVNVFGLQPFIATLAMASVCQGIAYIICDGRSVPIVNESFIKMGTERLLGVPLPAIFMVVLFVIFGFILAKTVFGRSVYMVGGNPTAARLAGLNPKRISTTLYMMSSAIAALAGVILAARMHSGQPGAVSGSEFDAITAAVLGGVAFSGGKGTILGCFIGLMIIQCFNNGLTVVNVSSFWQITAKGLLLIAALIFDYVRRKKLNEV